jgi:ABC-type Fe3+-hydroxamate transport system substrate-binding protein
VSVRRIVSLVPSETFNVARLGLLPRLVGRTRYCVEPSEVLRVPTVGGTKDVSVDEVVALAPDIVLANQEENRKQDVQRLRDAGLNVRLVFPTTVEEGCRDYDELAALLGSARATLGTPAPSPPTSRRCFVPIWRGPWMTVNGDTYIGDVVRWLGLVNVFGDLPSESAEGKDTRYAQVTQDQIEASQPEVVLLPDEPYRFGPKHAAWLRTLDIPAARTGAIHCVSGRDLCWHGAWAHEGLVRLRAVVDGV